MPEINIYMSILITYPSALEFWMKYDTNHPDGKYPDGGVSFETYVCPEMIEFETLGELKTLGKGDVSEHIEFWSLCKKTCDVDFKSDDSIDNMLDKI